MRRRHILLGAMLALASSTFVVMGSARQLRPGRPRPGLIAHGGKPMPDDAKAGLFFRLSDGEDDARAGVRPALAPATPLDEAATRRVLDRLPAMEAAPEEQQPFALREKSLPPPRTGKTLSEAFPPPSQGPAPELVPTGPLEVRRRTPEGDVPLAPPLSVTFSQPMVAVTSHAELARETRPVRLAPEPPGQWRWVGTKTLLFEPSGRFPMATDYRVEVPAGTRSATGGTLAQATSWAFSTPAPTVAASHPVGGPARRDPLMFVAFDQRVLPQVVIGSVQVRAAGQTYRARLASAEEVAADETVKALAAQAESGRFVAFRAEAPLPADTEVTVALAAGLASAEGPKTTPKPQEWRFRTFGPMRVKSHRCGWNDQCPPLTPWQVEFTNPIDAKAFRKEMVRVSPDLPAFKAEVYGASLNVRAPSKGRTRYTVTLGAGLPDTFGQTLEKDVVVTFDVGSAPPALFAPGGNFVVLDPAAGPRFSVYSINHETLRVRAFAVGPEDWPAFQKFMHENRGDDEKAPPPGRRALDTTVKVKGAPDELTETRLDLGAALPNRTGQLVLMVDPVQPDESGNRSVTARYRPSIRAWVQATKIGLDAFADDRELLAWATSLEDGRPLAEVSVRLVPGGAAASTAADGLATIPLADAAGAVLAARRGNDVAILPESSSWWGQGWKRRAAGDELRFYVADDRQMYRPGEEVHLKGWVRRVGMGRAGDVAEAGVQQVSYTLKDSRGNDVVKGTRGLGALGGFDLALKLPPTMNLGPAQLEIAVTGGLHRHTFQVQEFRRPEFEVTATASEGPFFLGEHATVTVAASYYAGGGLANADTTWSVTATPASYTPPHRDDFVFGNWVPWWRPWPGPDQADRVETHAGRTDGAGRHLLRIDFDRADPPRPTSVRAEASVMDVNRQAWAASAQLLVHPSSLYVGLKTGRAFVQKGQPLQVDAIVTDVDGKAVAGRKAAVRAERLDWEQDAGEWKETVAETQDCPVTSASDAVRCTFTSAEGGVYRIAATVKDDRGRPNETEMRIWVAGGKTVPRRGVEQEEVTLVPDRKEYARGDTAEVLVMAPFTPAEGLLTLRRSGIVRTERFTLAGASHTLRIPIEEAWTPNVHVQVDLVGAAARTNDAGDPDPKLPSRPAFASGSLSLPIPPRARTLKLEATPREAKLAPGGETTLDVSLRDAEGRPVAGADVAVAVVDEAVLALTGYRFPDPLGVFYPSRPTGVADQHLRASVLLGRPEDVRGDTLGAPQARLLDVAAETVSLQAGVMAPAPAMAKMAVGRGGGAPEPIRMRTDFNALALFAASLPTDGQGRAQVKVKLPDSLTRYRVMAVAAAGATQFGSGEATLTARLPLMVRPSAPRFLNFGDRFELPVVVQNQTDAPLSVDVAVRATNAALLAGAGRRVSVPANDRVEVRFPAAAQMAGTARFQVGAAADEWADAALVHLPVWTPATTEAFATYGQIDQGAIAQPVKAPGEVVPQFGGLEVTTSSTALQALTDAVLYLVAYPFECAEQLSSRVLAVAALKDVLTAFQAEGLPKPEEMTAAVKRDLERLRSLQNDDGAFAFWRRGDPAWPYVSIHVAHALERAKAKGFDVPDAMLERSRQYLKQVESHIPREYPEDARRTLVAYALYVRHRLGDSDPARARRLVQEAGLSSLSFEAIGWVLPVLSPDRASAVEVAAIRRHLANRATETAASAHFAVSYGDGAHLILHSDRRADAILLEALIADQPRSDLIPKLVEGLLGHRKAGRWENTQENVFVLLALDRYFGTYEKTTPDFVARAWLGERYAGEHAFRGRTTERHHLEIPMRTLLEGRGPVDLTLAKDGPGRLYYRIGMQYAPASLKLEAADHGFTIERSYEGIDEKTDVRRDPDGAWRIKSGSRVRVRLTMVAPSRRTHVALVDPLPAGLEASNPALRVTGSSPQGPDDSVTVIGARGLGGPRMGGSWWWWSRPWFEHQNLRDERVEAFASLLFEGVYTYSYVARATTPGTFVVPPPKAEEMYHPETFGRGPTDRVVVE